MLRGLVVWGLDTPLVQGAQTFSPLPWGHFGLVVSVYVKGMDLVAFHQDLFGSETKAFRVTPQQRRLYKGFPDKRGVSVTAEQAKVWKNPERLIGSLIVALARTVPYEGRTVYLLTPHHYEKWVEAQIRDAARHIIQRKKGSPENLRLLKDVFQQVHLRWNFAQEDEPEDWAAYGFCHEGNLPDWISNRLIKAPR